MNQRLQLLLFTMIGLIFSLESFSARADSQSEKQVQTLVDELKGSIVRGEYRLNEGRIDSLNGSKLDLTEIQSQIDIPSFLAICKDVLEIQIKKENEALLVTDHLLIGLNMSNWNVVGDTLDSAISMEADVVVSKKSINRYSTEYSIVKRNQNSIILIKKNILKNKNTNIIIEEGEKTIFQFEKNNIQISHPQKIDNLNFVVKCSYVKKP